MDPVRRWSGSDPYSFLMPGIPQRKLSKWTVESLMGLYLERGLKSDRPDDPLPIDQLVEQVAGGKTKPGRRIPNLALWGPCFFARYVLQRAVAIAAHRRPKDVQARSESLSMTLRKLRIAKASIQDCLDLVRALYSQMGNLGILGSSRPVGGSWCLRRKRLWPPQFPP